MFFHNRIVCRFKRCISSLALLSFLLGSCVLPNRASAQMFTYGNLPAPGSMLNSSAHFVPVMIKGLKIYGDDPLKFDFILDSGNAKVSEADFQNEGIKLAKYFLAGLTVPEKDLWVNLSPYEKDRIVPESFGQTLLGRDLLAQDYILKQLSSSLIHPNKDLGKTFWNQVYTKAKQLYGTTNIPVNTFNKVWIVPDKANVWENNGMAFVTSSHLKVLSEEDYLSLSKNIDNQKFGMNQISQNDVKAISRASADVVRQLLLPAIEKEVNEGENFANLRQIYNAMILAVWYKQALKDSLLSKVYVNQNKTTGVDDQDKQSKLKIYHQYLAAFKKGVFNFIKEEPDENNTVIPRKYFSGGADWAMIAQVEQVERGPLTGLSPTEQATVVGNVGRTRLFTWGAGVIGGKRVDDAMVVSSAEEAVYTQLTETQIPAVFGVDFAPHGFKSDQFWVAEVDPTQGKLIKPSSINLFKNTSTLVGVNVAILQAIAAAGYSGLLEHILGKVSKDFGKEIDAVAVKVGRESLEILAKKLDVVIVVGGNEGSFRDESKDMPLGLIMNPTGKNGTFMYFGDSVEVTNGVKLKIGKPGTYSMVTLVPLMMPSTDGYRISLAVDKFNLNKPFPKIDPVITNANSLRHVLEQLAEYMEAADADAFIKQMVSQYIVVTLNRPKHDQLKAQAKELGFSVLDREDGDPLLFIRAMLGIPGKDGKKLLAISTGGANEHIMSMVFAALYGKALMTTTYAATKTLKAVDKEYAPGGAQSGQGNLEKARNYSADDLKNYSDVNTALDKIRHAGFDVPQAPVTSEQLKAQLLTPTSEELSMLKEGKIPSSLVIASITGSNKLDWGVLQPYIQPVRWVESSDGSGKVIVSGFLINNEGKVNFFRASLKTDDVIKSRYSIVAHNDLLPNPLVAQYEKTRTAYMTMLYAGEIDVDIIGNHVKNIHSLLKNEETAQDSLKTLDDAFAAVQRDIRLEAEVVRAVREVERYILGNPSVQMEDGTMHAVVQPASAAMTTNVPPEQERLRRIVGSIAAPTKGFLAADGTTDTIEKEIVRAMGLKTLDELRAQFNEGQRFALREQARNVTFTSAALPYTVGGVIVYDEAAKYKDAQGRNLIDEHVIKRGVGVIHKADRGLKPDETSPLPSREGLDREKLPKDAGLDDLNTILDVFPNSVATKFRVTFTIDGDSLPTQANIEANAKALARHAYDTQKSGRAPTIEPEILINGDHSIDKSNEVMIRVLKGIFKALKEKGVWLPGVVLKTSMVLSGKTAQNRADYKEVARQTVDVLKKTVPAELGAIVFLSGGQSTEEALGNLNAIAQEARTQKAPWRLTYSYSRALKQPALKVWAGKAENIPAAQKVFNQTLYRAQAASLGVLEEFDALMAKIGIDALLAGQDEYNKMLAANAQAYNLGELVKNFDAAQVTSATAIQRQGGIDLRPDLFDLQIKRDDKGIPLPVSQQPIGSMKIQGFMPVTIDFKPVNLPLLLGAANNQEDKQQLTFK
ncbi:MAG: fructose-bisphosphate aldolase [Candidatus Omnitrophica bacterium]|nr:fructose-bisphosphate aldolase [Candidatus Omnitrophota bacterium]